jgi:hypothetical protein
MSTDPAGGDAQPDPGVLVEQLRAAPAAEILADVLSTLLSTAQVKLGRRDARMFIDLSALARDYAGPYLPDELLRQVDAALGRLRLAQVSAEAETATAAEPEPNDLDRAPAPPVPGPERAPEPSAPGASTNVSL